MSRVTHSHKRREHMEVLCVLCRGAQQRGNGFAFSYPPFASYLPRGVR